MDTQTVFRIINLLDQEPEKRSIEEIEEVLPYVTVKSFALGSIPRDSLLEVLKHAGHRKVKKNRFLKQMTGSNDRLFIVLKGGLSMFMEYQDNKLPPINKDHSNIRSVRQFGFRVDSFGPGKMFEERYILKNANIITDADTDLMVISKALYERAMQSQMERDSEATELFIKTHPFFCNWAEDQQEKLKSALVKKTFNANDEVMTQGADFKGIYFITKGRAKLSVVPRRHQKQYEQMFDENDMDKELLEIIRLHVPKKKDTMISRGDTKGSHMDDKTYVKRIDGGYVAAERMEFQKVVNISVVSSGEIFGDLEMLLNLHTNIFTVTTMSGGCEALFLPQKDFPRFLSAKKAPFTLRLMKFLSETKLLGRMASTQGQKVPIFPRLLYRLRHVRIEVKKSWHVIENDLPERKKGENRETKVQTIEELDKNYLRTSFLKDKGPFLKPFTPGTVYFKELMREKQEERASFKGQTSSFKVDENEKETYDSINKRLQQAIVEGVRESIRTEKVIKKLSLSWNKEKNWLPKL